MKNLKEKYLEKYGIAEKYVLIGLGGNLDEIIERFESAPAYPYQVDPMLTMPDEDSLHGVVMGEIESRYFRGIKRDAAVAVCNVLSAGNGDGTIKIDHRLETEYTAYTFMLGWNKEHDEADKIYGPTSFEI